MRLGVCYYPEQWDEMLWRDDARRMADIGLSVVRIAEFAWSMFEPSPGEYDWGWCDRAIEILSGEGLEIILGAPTATPPKWLVDAHPEIIAWDREGRKRNFGSRRHYCFSSPVYREQSSRITSLLAERYGAHESVVGWQTDNEYGCHDTVRSYSPAAEYGFRKWLENRYADIANLNEAWGAVFWSQSYRSFGEVDLPHLTVTEPNPSHLLDFYRFSSDQVVAFNRSQVDILRKLSPGRDIYHNYMGFFTDFDHFKLSEDIDVAAWDSYPLGFLDVSPYRDEDKRRYLRQGHPDFAAFHHDLYRGCGRGRFAVLEQQPGPVNWAQNNPAPLPGMVRLWTHEAAAHGAELVSYFRWRQAPFAQEQMHAGLLRSDNAPAIAYDEVKQVAGELKEISERPASPCSGAAARVALVFCYETQWMSEIQPQGGGWNYLQMAYEWYSVARRYGHNIDIISTHTDLRGYEVVLAPSVFCIDSAFLERIKESGAQIVFGPRSGSKTETMQTPRDLAPGPLQSLLALKIVRSESFPDFHHEAGAMDSANVYGKVWLDHVETHLNPIAVTNGGAGLCFRDDRFWLLTTCPQEEFLLKLFANVLEAAGLSADLLPAGIRLRQASGANFAFNYDAEESFQLQAPLKKQSGFLVGGASVPPAGVTVW